MFDFGLEGVGLLLISCSGSSAQSSAAEELRFYRDLAVTFSALKPFHVTKENGQKFRPQNLVF